MGLFPEMLSQLSCCPYLNPPQALCEVWRRGLFLSGVWPPGLTVTLTLDLGCSDTGCLNSDAQGMTLHSKYKQNVSSLIGLLVFITVFISTETSSTSSYIFWFTTSPSKSSVLPSNWAFL